MGVRPVRLVRRALGALGRVVLFVVLTLAVAEGALRLASLFARTRGTAWRGEALGGRHVSAHAREHRRDE